MKQPQHVAKIGSELKLVLLPKQENAAICRHLDLTAELVLRVQWPKLVRLARNQSRPLLSSSYVREPALMRTESNY